MEAERLRLPAMQRMRWGSDQKLPQDDGEIDRLISEVYENKIALKEFELKALTAQINPHFLYNSLSIINWMAIKSGQKEISKVTLDLSTFIVQL